MSNQIHTNQINTRQIAAVTRKEWLHIMRDPMTIFLLAIGPVLMLIIVAYAMATDVKNVKTVVLDQDRTVESAALIAQLDDDPVLHVTGDIDSRADAEQKLKRRDAKLVVIIEAGFGEQVSTAQGIQSRLDDGPRVSFIVDGTDPISAEAAMEAAYKQSEAYMTTQQIAALDAAQSDDASNQLAQMSRDLLKPAITVTVENRYNPDLKATWDLVPALIAVALMLPGMSIATVIARERDQGTLEALVATPIDKHAILLGKTLPYVATSLVNVVLMFAVARVVFGVPFAGNLALYLALSTLYVFATLAIGLLLSVLIGSQEAALWAAMLVFLFPGMMLSGMFFPVEIFPLLIRLETIELPATSGVLINRGMFLQGVGITVLWWNALVLGGIAVAGFEISRRLFKKRIA